jgi:hypothetical protein
MSDEPKIFVDEDWKAQVQREREAAQKAKEAAPEAGPAAAAAAPESLAEDELPEGASFMSLVSSLATQCMFALGLIAQPGQQQVMVDLDQAQFLLDTMGILLEKTKGNLTPEEEGGLKQAIAELGEVYIARVQQFQEETIRTAGNTLKLQ